MSVVPRFIRRGIQHLTVKDCCQLAAKEITPGGVEADWL